MRASGGVVHVMVCAVSAIATEIPAAQSAARSGSGTRADRTRAVSYGRLSPPSCCPVIERIHRWLTLHRGDDLNPRGRPRVCPRLLWDYATPTREER